MRGNKRIGLLFLVGVGAIACLVSLLSLETRVVRARKGYGGYGGGKGYCGSACQARRYKSACAKGCGQAKRTCLFCAKKDRSELVANCRSALQAARAACTGSRPCRSQAKSVFRTCKRQASQVFAQCSQNGGQCGSCCRSSGGQGSCRGYFEGTPGYGGYQRTYRHYGKTYRQVPDCTPNTTLPGSQSGAVPPPSRKKKGR